MNSFIVNFWAAVFDYLNRVSIFYLVRSIFPRIDRSYNFVDAWVLAHLCLAFVSVFAVALDRYDWLSFALVTYGAVRVFEITVYQVNVLLFDQYRAQRSGKTYAVRGFRRLVLLLMHNYFEIVFWFSCSYIFFADSFEHKWSASYKTALGAIYSSFITMSTFGDFNLDPKDFFGATVLFAQSICGLFMTLLTLARFIALLPQPSTMDVLERK